MLLKKIELSDAETIAVHLASEDVSKWTTHIPFPYTLHDAHVFVEQVISKREERTDFVFGIFEKKESELTGVIGLNNIDWKNKVGEIGYWIGEKYWNKGLATEAVKKMLQFCFEESNLKLVYAKVYESNKASIRVLEKNGFLINEGYVEFKEKNGQKYIMLRFSIHNL